MHKLLVIVFCFLFSGFALWQNPWELVVNKEEIKIYVRKSDSSSIKEYRAMMLVKAPMDSVIKKILDVKNLKTWNYKTTNTSLVKKISDTSWVFYMQNDLDWPIKDRDHVSRVVMKKMKKECIITLTPENNLIKENPDFIRVKNFRGIWFLKKIDEKQTQIIQQLYGDPESYVPAFIINSMLTKAPFETFKLMRSQLEKSNKSVSNSKN